MRNTFFNMDEKLSLITLGHKGNFCTIKIFKFFWHHSITTQKLFLLEQPVNLCFTQLYEQLVELDQFD